MESILAYVWFLLFLLPLLLFIILDGADLGLGIIALIGTGDERSKLIESVGPLWYANETWLVISGAILFGAFPQAYSLVLSSLYIPLMMLVFGLMLRAASIELRGHTGRSNFWGIVFGIGCLLAALGQGFMLGGLLTGLNIQNGSYTGGAWDWFGLTSIVVALGIVASYVMLSTAHMMKSHESGGEASIQWILRVSKIAAFVLFLLAAILIFMRADFRVQVGSPQRLPWLIGFTAAAIVGYIMPPVTYNHTKTEKAPYKWAVFTFLSVFGAIVSATFPYLVPFSLSVTEAASSNKTLVFMLPSVGVFLLVIIVYNIFIKRVFGCKVQKQLKKGSAQL